MPNLDLQPGTGSFDYFWSLTYIKKYKQFGMYSNFNYKFNTYNIEGYKYRSVTNSTLNAFFQTKGENISFIALVGGWIS